MSHDERIRRFRAIRARYYAMGDTAVELFTRPGATDEQILFVARNLGRVRQQLIDLRLELIKVLNAEKKLRLARAISDEPI